MEPDKLENKLDRENYVCIEKSKKLKYLTNVLDREDISLDYIKEINMNCNRNYAVERISKALTNIDIALEIEAGIFEFTLIETVNNDALNYYQTFYNDKLNNTLSNFDNELSTYNPLLIKKLKRKEIVAQELAFMRPVEINPKNWEAIIKKNELREYKKNNMATTTLYKCYKCGERKCSVLQIQKRSADEPMSNIITCLVCENQWEK